jgi:ribosome-binding factor A
VKQTKRTHRVAEVVHREVGRMLLTEDTEGRLARVVLTDCQVSTDLRIARLYYALLEPGLEVGEGEAEAGGVAGHVPPTLEQAKAEAKAALEAARGHFRHLLGRALRTKYTPELFFHYDETLEHARRIEAMLHELGPLEPEPEPESDEPPGPGLENEPETEEPA